MSKHTNGRAHGRVMLWSLLIIAVGAVVAPLSGYVYVSVANAQQQNAQQQQVSENGDSWSETNPRSEYWRAVRRGDTGYSTDKTRGGNNLIFSSGQDWRQIRNGPVPTLGGWFLPLVALAIGLFFILKGQAKLKEPRSGRTITRWTLAERILHWATAALFVVLAITGLSILFGRAVLIPLLGHEGFSAWASVAKLLHNYSGPLFTVGIVLMIVSWIKDNIPKRTDLIWFKKGGGMFGEHAPAGRMNGGEKAWFWFIATFGVAVCISGLVFNFPNWVESRFVMQIANVIHAALAIGWIGLFFGHAYIGTLGTEGALEGMTTGEVDETWAKQHHDLWYEEVKNAPDDTRAVPTQPSPGDSGPAPRSV